MLEIAGVSAYDDPVEAYWHGGERPEDWQMFAAFYGMKVCDLGPEKDRGGVIAAVVKPLPLMTPAQYCNCFLNGREPPNPHRASQT